MAKRISKEEPKKKVAKKAKKTEIEPKLEAKPQEIPGGKNDRAKYLDAAFDLIAGKLGVGETWVKNVEALGLDPQKVLEARMDILMGRI